MVYTCKKARTYIVLRSSKVSKSKPLSKQGKVIRMKCSGSAVASKYASAVYKKSHRKLKSVILYRKGRVSRYSISCKETTSGKPKFSAKLTSKSTVSKAKKKTTKRKTKKTKKTKKTSKTSKGKRCPTYSRRSPSKKSCLKNKLVIRRKSKALSKARAQLKKAKASLATRKRQLAKSNKTLSKTKAGTKSRTRAKATVRKYKGKVATKSKTVTRLQKLVKKKASALASAKKLPVK